MPNRKDSDMVFSKRCKLLNGCPHVKLKFILLPSTWLSIWFIDIVKPPDS
jgi:hypothetical protein